MEYSPDFKDSDICKLRDRVASEITETQNNNVHVSHISKEMICFAFDRCDSYDRFKEKVKLLLNPKEYEQDDLEAYLFLMNEIISNVILTTNFYQRSVYGYMDRYRVTKRLLKLIEELRPYSKNDDLLIGNLGIATLIIAYIYANDFDNYEMLHKFLSDPDFYYKKLDETFPTCKVDYDYLNEVDNFPYLAIYDNLEKILFGTKEIKIIK